MVLKICFNDSEILMQQRANLFQFSYNSIISYFTNTLLRRLNGVTKVKRMYVWEGVNCS